MSRTLKPPLLIAIAGPSCSGKTELARGLADALKETHPILLPLDAYYKDLSDLPDAEQERHNFDHPDSLDAPLLLEQARRLAAGEPVKRPVYDYAAHRRQTQTIRLEPQGLVLLEGLFALYWEELRRLCALRIYMDIDDDTALARRLLRDRTERGAPEEFTRWQWEHHVLPMAREFVRPTRRHADLVLDGGLELSSLIESVLRELRLKKPP
jgi:uridine kinase